MAGDLQSSDRYTQMWQDLAEVLNRLPIEDQEAYRKVLGEYLHDMKHTLGLITNANEILRRDVGERPERSRSLEMINIIHTGALQLDGYLTTMVEEFANRIEASEDQSGQ